MFLKKFRLVISWVIALTLIFGLFNIIEANEKAVEEKFLQSAEFQYSSGNAKITISTKSFEKFDVAVLTDAECTGISFESDFNTNVRINEDYIFTSIFNKEALDDMGNKYAVITGSGTVTSDGSQIPYEGKMASFTFENVKVGTKFVVVSNSANYSEDITKAPVIGEFEALAQKAEIDYEDGVSSITIYTESFNSIDVAVVSDFECTKISYDSYFTDSVRYNEDYIFAAVFNKNAIDDVGNKYAVVVGSGAVAEDASAIPYEGKVVTFRFENVEEGAEFLIVFDSAKFSDVTEAPVITNLTAIPQTKYVVNFIVDGQIINSQKVKPGEAAVAPETPVKAEDDLFTYEFIGWDKEFDNVTENMDVTALFKPVEKLIMGDVKQDGIVDANDALDILKTAAKIQELEETLIMKADVNKDGVVDAQDALMVLKFAARLVDSL